MAATSSISMIMIWGKYTCICLSDYTISLSSDSKYVIICRLLSDFLNVANAVDNVRVKYFTGGVKYVGLDVKLWKICLASSAMLPWV